ncbi:RNA/RNP complex-1-interacting phosphatase [Platysternon megacephalum]|uniref:RNA/RNP complex-1-interacting phosphatase n=1 Tax=Platysternon megacephalum TaxID=55544 RepID=A0A4D9DMQ7_9SAUR|nr:RNA/RNP complex-1-interacting phosphatase [Platysternon megacephalum]
MGFQARTSRLQSCLALLAVASMTRFCTTPVQSTSVTSQSGEYGPCGRLGQWGVGVWTAPSRRPRAVAAGHKHSWGPVVPAMLSAQGLLCGLLTQALLCC